MSTHERRVVSNFEDCHFLYFRYGNESNRGVSSVLAIDVYPDSIQYAALQHTVVCQSFDASRFDLRGRSFTISDKSIDWLQRFVLSLDLGSNLWWHVPLGHVSHLDLLGVALFVDKRSRHGDFLGLGSSQLGRFVYLGRFFGIEG